MSGIVDLSHRLESGMPIYPGDPAVGLTDAGQEEPWRVLSLTLGSHSGTHIDAAEVGMAQHRRITPVPIPAGLEQHGAAGRHQSERLGQRSRADLFVGHGSDARHHRRYDEALEGVLVDRAAARYVMPVCPAEAGRRRRLPHQGLRLDHVTTRRSRDSKRPCRPTGRQVRHRMFDGNQQSQGGRNRGVIR